MTVVCPSPTDDGSEVPPPPPFPSPMLLRIIALSAGIIVVALEMSTLIAYELMVDLHISLADRLFYTIPPVILVFFFTPPYMIFLFVRGCRQGETDGAKADLLSEYSIVGFLFPTVVSFVIFMVGVYVGENELHNREALIMAWISFICGSVLVPFTAMLVFGVGILQGVARRQRFELPVKNYSSPCSLN